MEALRAIPDLVVELTRWLHDAGDRWIHEGGDWQIDIPKSTNIV